MPIRFIKIGGEEEAPTEPVGVPMGAIGPTLKPSVEFFRGPSPWHQLMDKQGFKAGIEKLSEIVKSDLKVTEPDVVGMIPCIVELSEAHSKAEEERIRVVYKKFSKAYGSIVDRLVRFRPESRAFAFDSLKQDILDARPLWLPFECTRFRPKQEMDHGAGEGKRRKKMKDNNTSKS